MKIILAGYNLDHGIIGKFRESDPEAQDLTPETIAAAYARISRSPKPVHELRGNARKEVEKARQSNRNIVFEMGHSSIAEHAVFNVDVLGISRLLVEDVEKFRLASYTEKSQRYVLFKDDFVLPEEVKHAGLGDAFEKVIRAQNKLYQGLYGKLRPYVFEKHRDLAADASNRSMLEGWAKEDARYVISLATETQLGMTVNARNLELMLRRLAAHSLAEGREYSRRLYEATKAVAPSLIRYTEATEYDRETRQALRDNVRHLMKKGKGKGVSEAPGESHDLVCLIYATPDADDRVVASLMHSSSSLPMKQCLKRASQLGAAEKKRFIRTALRSLKAHDPVLREFEYADLVFDLVVSASCFAQMKRHRMATITGQDYDPSLGVTIPPAIRDIGMDRVVMDLIDGTNEFYERLKKSAPSAAAYILTNAHRKRIAMKVNARELYHIARLRADRHAQWDIRNTAEEMLRLGKAAMPLTLALAAGKDRFGTLHRQFIGSDTP